MWYLLLLKQLTDLLHCLTHMHGLYRLHSTLNYCNLGHSPGRARRCNNLSGYRWRDLIILVDGCCARHNRLHPDILWMDPMPGLSSSVLCLWVFLLINGVELATSCLGIVPRARPDDVARSELTINIKIQRFVWKGKRDRLLRNLLQ